eukprot:scaffold29226_cov110-Isochrysis_galbana.AAC.6
MLVERAAAPPRPAALEQPLARALLATCSRARETSSRGRVALPFDCWTGYQSTRLPGTQVWAGRLRFPAADDRILHDRTRTNRRA